VKDTGFAGYIGGILLCIFSVILVVLGIVVLAGFLNSYITSYNVAVGIIILAVALFLFAYGWYLYKSNKPRGTINVHNV